MLWPFLRGFEYDRMQIVIFGRRLQSAEVPQLLDKRLDTYAELVHL